MRRQGPLRRLGTTSGGNGRLRQFRSSAVRSLTERPPRVEREPAGRWQTGQRSRLMAKRHRSSAIRLTRLPHRNSCADAERQTCGTHRERQRVVPRVRSIRMVSPRSVVRATPTEFPARRSSSRKDRKGRLRSDSKRHVNAAAQNAYGTHYAVFARRKALRG